MGAHKAAFYVAALCTVLPPAMGANASPRNTVRPLAPEPMFARYLNDSPVFRNEARLGANADLVRERDDIVPLDARPNGSAACDLIVTLPSGLAICFFIQW